MTNGEHQALAAVQKVFPYTTDEKRMKKLGEEFTELSFALASGDANKIKDEIGDMAFILLHILSRYDSKNEGIVGMIVHAKTKMEQRVQDGYYKHLGITPETLTK